MAIQVLTQTIESSVLRVASRRCQSLRMTARSFCRAIAVVCFGFVFALPTLANDLIALEEHALGMAVQKVAPSVVRIETFAGLERAGRAINAATTGVVVDEDGYVISSAINFFDKPSAILVTLKNGKRVSASIVARDHSRQLVLLKVQSEEKLSVPTAVPREEMRVGQWAVAVGKTFDEDQVNISVGILSATSRIWGKAIQCDAKISPSNYGGPLIDIHGRVLGILAPLSPQSDSELAGSEWYDSGIGFAVLLADVNRKLAKLKKGEDCHRGLLGISLKGGDMFGAPAEVSVSQPNSPAYDAGIKAGDTIVKVNGSPVTNQAQLKHSLGPLYAGDTVEIVVVRGEAELSFDVELTDELLPYEHPFLGILPRRDSEEALLVRYVFADSPAAQAGVESGDLIQSIDSTAIKTESDLRTKIATKLPGEDVVLQIQRGDGEIEIKATLGSIPSEIPADLPPAIQIDESDDHAPEVDEAKESALTDIKLPEEESVGVALIPDDYSSEVPHGLLIHLDPPGEFKRHPFENQWEQTARDSDLIVLAPQPTDSNRWLRTEVEFIRKLITQMKKDYNIDSNRIVLGGYQAGGAMAYLVALNHRTMVRGIVAIDAAMPITLQPPFNDPVNRMSFYLASAKDSRQKRRTDVIAKALRDRKFPIVEVDLGQQPRRLRIDERNQLGRWIDCLDRI